MNAASDVAVTLSPELLDRLRIEAQELGLPLEYVVASLVVDTVESLDGPARSRSLRSLARAG
jgi:hypothetical protein